MCETFVFVEEFSNSLPTQKLDVYSIYHAHVHRMHTRTETRM